MATKTTFLNTPYGGYLYRDVPKEDEELTHVGPGTPGGEYLRRFWQPVALSEELKDLPRRIRILGEDLVAFRDLSGRAGLLQLFCSHRGTSLEFGLVSERGIRCCYHGWLYDVDGRILETPGEPQDSTLRDRLCHGAYPVHQYKGLVFAYMGPPDSKPPFPIYDLFDIPELPKTALTRHEIPCNWLQIKENVMDPVHLVFLHTIVSGAQFTQDFGNLSELGFVETPLGMAYTDVRRLGDDVWVRMADYIAPNIHQFPISRNRNREERVFSRPQDTVWAVPVDDGNIINMRIRRFLADEEIPENIYFGQQADRPFEERQRQPGDYEARCSIYDGIAVHAREHLATTDRGVIQLRNMVKQGIEAVQNGQDPKGVFRTSEGIIPTYSNQRMLRIPPAQTPAGDKRLLREIGQKVAEETLANPPGVGGPEGWKRFARSLEESYRS